MTGSSSSAVEAELVVSPSSLLPQPAAKGTAIAIAPSAIASLGLNFICSMPPEIRGAYLGLPKGSDLGNPNGIRSQGVGIVKASLHDFSIGEKPHYFGISSERSKHIEPRAIHSFGLYSPNPRPPGTCFPVGKEVCSMKKKLGLAVSFVGFCRPGTARGRPPLHRLAKCRVSSGKRPRSSTWSGSPSPARSPS